MIDFYWLALSRLGEVTLKDVKAAVDREGNYRYHFKALDPEFGTVKEEVSQRWRGDKKDKVVIEH